MMDSSRPLAADGYEQLGQLGVGGMATVSKVRCRSSGEILALKRLRPIDDPAKAARVRMLFEREFHTLSQLAHPRVVRVCDYDVDAHGPYFTMELLEGGDLHARAPVPWQRACAYMRDVCSVLSLLHARRVVHRDVSPRNIRCTAEGTAKLIDFGAMAPMGPSKEAVGTPAICAPEVVQHEPLDARTDVFSLGCTIYYALVGKHAYPASEFGQLPLLWNSPPARPSRFVPALPADLDALIMSMVSVDPESRPSSASEVMERLVGIVRQPTTEQLPVSHAYLSSPRLVGREGALDRIHKKLAQLKAGRGGALMVLGPTGAGRTRLLDAALLEAKLSGASVLRADAGDAQRGECGVVAALGRQLWQARPGQARLAAAEDLSLLGRLWPGVLPAGETPAQAQGTDAIRQRAELQQGLLRWLRGFSRQRPLVIGVDDIERIDEFSQAFIALLAHEAPGSALLVITTSVSDLEGGAVRAPQGLQKLLVDASNKIVLDGLSVQETEALLGSVFGDDRLVGKLAQRLHRVAQGNARDLMSLAQHLVDRRLVRYEAGAWSMPKVFDDAELPVSMGDSLRERIACLDEDATMLARTMALSPALSVSGAEMLRMLGADADQGRLVKAADALLLHGIVRGSGSRFQFSQGGWVAPLLADVTRAERSALHLRLVDVYLLRGDLFRVALHRMHAGDREAGVDALLAHVQEMQQLTADNAAGYAKVVQSMPDDWLDLYERALRYCTDQGRSAAARFSLLRHAASLITSGLGEPAVILEKVQILSHASGLDLLAGLEPGQSEGERLRAGLALAQARYEATPEHARVLSPREAMAPLAGSLIEALGSVASRMDLALWNALPPLRPLAAASPVFGVLDELAQGVRCRITARTDSAVAHYEKVLSRVSEPDRAGLDTAYQHYLLCGVACGLGALEAARGSARALELAAQIDTEPLYQDQAQLIRMQYHLWQGDLRRAEACRQQFEVVRIQHGGRQFREVGQRMGELSAYAASDDLVRLKHALPEVFQRAERVASWLPVLNFARGEYHRMRGAQEDALQELEMACAMVSPGQHQMFGEISGAYLRALAGTGRVRQARERGVRQLRAVLAEGLGYTANFMRMPLACIHAELGELEAAHSLADEALAQLDVDDMGKLLRGLACETRARVALEAGDEAAFEEYAGRCAEHYLAHGNRALVAKYERLTGAARGAGFTVKGRAAIRRGFGASGAVDLSVALTECSAPERRAARAMELMLESCGALGGALYAVERKGPMLAAEVGLSPHSPSVEPLVRTTLLSQGAGEALDLTQTNVTVAAKPGTVEARGLGIPGDDVHVMYTALVAHGHEGELCVTGLAVFTFDRGRAFVAPSDLAAQLSRYWFEVGDAASMSTRASWSWT